MNKLKWYILVFFLSMIFWTAIGFMFIIATAIFQAVSAEERVVGPFGKDVTIYREPSTGRTAIVPLRGLPTVIYKPEQPKSRTTIEGPKGRTDVYNHDQDEAERFGVDICVSFPRALFCSGSNQ